MDAKTRALHQGLIRLAKGAIKLWEGFIEGASAQYPDAPVPAEKPAPAGGPK